MKKLAAVVALSLLGVVPAGVALADPNKHESGKGPCRDEEPRKSDDKNPHCNGEKEQGKGGGNGDGEGNGHAGKAPTESSSREVVFEAKKDGFTVTVTRDRTKPAEREFDGTVTTPPSDGRTINVQQTIDTAKQTAEHLRSELERRAESLPQL